MHVKRRFSLTHVTKTSAQTFSKAFRRRGKTLHTFLDFLTEQNLPTDLEHEVDK